jgi:hypothetical protein
VAAFNDGGAWLTIATLQCPRTASARDARQDDEYFWLDQLAHEDAIVKLVTKIKNFRISRHLVLRQRYGARGDASDVSMGLHSRFSTVALVAAAILESRTR